MTKKDPNKPDGRFKGRKQTQKQKDNLFRRTGTKKPGPDQPSQAREDATTASDETLTQEQIDEILDRR